MATSPSPSTPAITLEVLPAAYGDCLLVSCPVGRGTWRMLVDTGTDEVYPVLRQRLAKLPLAADGRRHIDLFVVTHIDHDHIGGAALLLADKALGVAFGDVWFNAPPAPAARGVAEGEALGHLLGAGGVALPWNRAWSGRPVCTPAVGGNVAWAARRGAPRLTLLSPGPQQLQDLYKVWEKELERLRRKERDVPEPEPPQERGEPASLQALASRVTPVDRSVPNGSAIAFLLEHRGASVLLCADAFPTVLVPALKALAKQRGLHGPLAVDAIKLSHHGSRANVTTDLLTAVKAPQHVFSTNNAIFKHPSEEAVARAILSGGEPTLWFNHDTEQNRRWDAAALKAQHGYQVRYPARPGEGVVLELPAHPPTARR